MKKIFLFSLMILTFFTVNRANSITYEEALNQSKPMAIMIYADWADNLPETQQIFDAMSALYGKQYNFIKLNIASSDTKAFNKTYHIYPNLPYVLLFKDRGKISRYLQKNCILDKACFASKLDVFKN